MKVGRRLTAGLRRWLETVAGKARFGTRAGRLQGGSRGSAAMGWRMVVVSGGGGDGKMKMEFTTAVRMAAVRRWVAVLGRCARLDAPS